MSRDEKSVTDSAKLRRNAVKVIREKAPTEPKTSTLQSSADLRKMLHELQVHQIELEMQNEELRRAKEELESTQARYFDLYDLAPVGYVTLSKNGFIQEANLTLATMLGRTRRELINQPLASFIVPADQNSWQCYLQQIPDQKLANICELRMHRKKTGSFWARIKVGIAHNVAGPALWRTIISDISTQKRTDSIYLSRLHLLQFAETHTLAEILVETLNELEKLTESSIGFYHFYNETARIVTLHAWSTRTSREFCRAAGSGSHYPLEKAGVWVDCIRAGKPVIHNDYATVPHRKGLPDGHAMVVRELVVPVKRANQIVAILGVGNKPGAYSQEDVNTVSLFADLAFDITERKGAEEALKEANDKLETQNSELRQVQKSLELSQRKYEKLYSSAPVGYFIIDLHGIIREVNHVGAQLLGSEKERLVNRPFAGFIADDDNRATFANHLKCVFHRHVLLRCELDLTRIDGIVTHGHLQSVEITIANNESYILTSLIDGTVRKQLEDKLQSAHNDMEATVHERTGELTRTNRLLMEEISEHKQARESLQKACEEINTLKKRLQAENTYLQAEVDRQYNFGEIIGQSSILSRVFLQVEQVAPMNATVLLQGETGTGKGMLARAIHSRSPRKNRPLITVNCATLPASLVESELFGRERGAFTGSDVRQIGRFELADGGTIFLDEIGELPLELQCKLLRVIQDGEFERLGNPRTIKTDARIIAATNRNLEEAIKNGKFREDLFYRLNVFPITIPPLRQRKEDIPLLVNHFLAKFNKKIGKRIDTIPSDTLNTLQEYQWPGNVRELESVMERAVITSQGTELKILDRFETTILKEEHTGQELKGLLELEHDHILQVLTKVGWRIEGKNGAAVLLGLNASTLRARMRKYGISRQT